MKFAFILGEEAFPLESVSRRANTLPRGRREASLHPVAHELAVNQVREHGNAPERDCTGDVWPRGNPAPLRVGPQPRPRDEHRIHPVLWDALQQSRPPAASPAAAELTRFLADPEECLSKRPVFSQVGHVPPWEPRRR